MVMLGECVISSVLSLCSKHLKWWTSVTGQLQLSFIWQAKENTSSRCEGGLSQKKRGLNFGSSFYIFFLLPLSQPYVNCASQEGCLFHLRYSLVLGPSFVPFLCASPFLSFSHHHLGLLLPILTTYRSPCKRWETQFIGSRGVKVSLATSSWAWIARGIGLSSLANLKPQSPYNSVHLRVSDIFHGQV